MEVVRIFGSRDLRFSEEPPPILEAGKALIRVTAVGVCGSDLHWFAETGIGDTHLEHPLVLGHEFAGIVEEVGSGSELQPGQLVAVDPAIPCGDCHYCRFGHPNLCSHLIFAGNGPDDGAMRERMNWPEKCLFPLPGGFNALDGALLEPLGVAIHAIDLGHLRTGMTVGIFGFGPIGALIMQVARAAGASRILVTDRLPHRLDYARKAGADEVFLAESGEEIPEVVRASGGDGVDVSFEAAGENDAVDTAVESARAGGRVVLVGIPADDRTSFRASAARRKGLTLALTRRMKHTYPRAIRLVQSGLVDLRSLVTHRFPLHQAQSAFETAEKREGMKVVIDI